MPRIRMESITPDVDEKNRYTIYWLGGTRSVIKGDTVEQAFTLAGYGRGATRAVDWYDDGITETHYWDKENKEWIKYNPARIPHSVFSTYLPDAMKLVITANLESCHGMIIEMSDKSEFSICYKIGNFASIGWMKYIEVAYGEYHRGNYGDDEIDEDSDDHHFMVCAGEYFDPEQPELAIDAFVQRFINNPSMYSNKGVSLEEIKASQLVF